MRSVLVSLYIKYIQVKASSNAERNGGLSVAVLMTAIEHMKSEQKS